MSFFTSIGPWLGSLIALALGGAILVGIATLLSRCIHQPVWQRVVWQMSMIGLGLLFLADGSGLVDGAIAWSRETLAVARILSAPTAPEEEQPAENPDFASAALPQAPIATSEPFTESAGPPSEETSSEPNVSTSLLPQVSTLRLGVLWLAGALVVASRILFARALLAVFRRRCISIGGGALVERVSRISQQLGLRRRVRVVEAPRLLSPAAFGFFRPTIALPAGFADSLTSEQQDVIVAHELAHLAAHDPAWRVFTDIVTALWWWHPLVWWSRQQLHAASELAADEASLLVTDGPALLATCLVELGGRMLGERQTGWVRITGNGFRSGLGRRVKRLLSLSQQSRRSPRRWQLAVSITLGPVLLLSAALFSTAWARPRPSDEGGSPMTMREAWRHSFAGMLLCTAIGTNGNAAGGDEVVKPAAPEPTRPEAINPPSLGDEDTGEKPGTNRDNKTELASKTKVFRLKHADPGNLASMLNSLLDLPFDPVAHGIGGFKPLGVGEGTGSGARANELPPARLAVDARTNSLIVRGSETQLAIAADLVAVLDLPADKPVPKVKSLSAFRLKFADVGEVSGVLNRLSFQSRIDASDNTLIVVGPEKELKEIGEVIEQLDVEGKRPKPEKKPAGGTGGGN